MKPPPASPEEAASAEELWLGPQSPLAGVLPGFDPRPGQMEMARGVARCLRQGVPLLVEAGTGTGKTLAYLVPAVLSGLKVVVSTGTRTLQDQISGKELPLLKRAMEPGLRWAVLKGRGNYLCRRRFEQFSSQPDLSLPGAASALKLLAKWARASASGDLDEIRGQGLPERLAAEVTSTSEQCLGGRCSHRDDCHLMEARRRAAEADVVVVNHHLFMADLALKAEGHGEALPRYQAVIFDEAHLLAEVATMMFGVTVSHHRLQTLLRDVAREAPAAQAAALACSAAGSDFFARLGRMGRGALSWGLTPELLASLTPAVEKFSQALDSLAAALPGDEEEEALAARAQAMAQDLSAAGQPVAGRTVAWAQSRGARVSLHLSPVEVGPYLETMLYQEHSRLVFTSATLAVAGDLELARRRLGLDSDTLKMVVPSPFDPASQALLYVPGSMPPPNSPAFAGAVAEQVAKLLELSQGRAFVLFTSHRNLEAVSSLLIPQLPYPCLVQGQAPRMKLLQSFVEKCPSVLFATASFWQGVDVPGPALSSVIVDKLPFAPPDDPLVAARMELVQAEGKSGFAHLMLPEAVLSLKQGLGRLLRTPQDRGLLAVLDTRLCTKPYGKVFLRALEPVPLTRELDQVARFFAQEPPAQKKE